MKCRIVVFLAMMLAMTCCAFAQEPTVPQKLQNACMTVRDDYRHIGSGVVITNEVDGKKTHWVLTVAHVVDGFREVRTEIGTDGQERKKVVYRSPTVSFQEREGTRYAGKTILEAEVVSADGNRDLALLRVQKTARIAGSIDFYKGKDAPPVGSPIYHCATPGDELNAASLTAGIICQHGRIFEREGFGKGEYDQMDAAGMPGSSGGMVCLQKTGELVGVISLGIRSTDNFHYFVPVRTIHEWLKEINAEWLLEPNAKITEEDVKKVPLELTSFDDNSDAAPTAEKEVEHNVEFVPSISKKLTKVRQD